MITYNATLKKFTDGTYASFKLLYFAPGKKDASLIVNHTGELFDDALLALKREVENFPPGTRFEILAKKNAKDTNDTAHNWQFSNSDMQAAAPAWPAQPQQFGGFAGFGGFGSLVDPQELKEERKRLEGLKDELNKKELTLIIREHELNRNRENHERIVKEDKERIETLEKKFNSHAQAAQRGVEMVLGEVITGFAEDGNFGRFGGKLMGLQPNNSLGAPNDEEHEEEATPERKKIEAIAADIFNSGLGMDELNKLHGSIMKTVKVWKTENTGGGE